MSEHYPNVNAHDFREVTKEDVKATCAPFQPNENCHEICVQCYACACQCAYTSCHGNIDPWLKLNRAVLVKWLLSKSAWSGMKIRCLM